jgi:hypothetical protein
MTTYVSTSDKELTVSSRQEREVIRLRVMKAIYDASGGSTQESLNLAPMCGQLGLSEGDMADAVNYAEGEGLVERLLMAAGQRMPLKVRLTHKGLVEMEESEKAPEEQTEHFPAQVSVFNIGGNMIGSAIQTGSPGATQRVQVGDIAIGGETDSHIRAFLAEYDAKVAGLRREQTSEALAEIGAEIETVKAQITSPKPKKHFIKESLASIRATLENGIGGVVTSGLLLLLGQIHW